jgi:hypothetical protein
VSEADPIAWAKSEVSRLRSFAKQASTPAATEVTGRALQFFKGFAAGTVFEQRAELSFRYYDRESEPILAVAQQLEEWVAYEESGLPALKPFEVRFRVEASTDIMEQAQELLKVST